MTKIRLQISGEYTQIPSDRKIFGNFIESGFGCQIRGMWSEMLYNRAFRKVPEYKKATWEWLGLDAAHYNENAPFWHSGYEENDWEIMGNPVVRHSCVNYTYKGALLF